MIKVILLFAFSTVGISSQAELPGRFAEVSPGIFRSAQPSGESLAELKALGIKTILDINDDDEALEQESAAAKAVGIALISRPMSGFWSPDDETVNANLADLSNKDLYPILVHCQHGEDRTGLIIGLHRVYAEGLKPAVAYQEMLDRGFHKILFMLDRYFKSKTGFDD